jgi:hypothetical protein
MRSKVFLSTLGKFNRLMLSYLGGLAQHLGTFKALLDSQVQVYFLLCVRCVCVCVDLIIVHDCKMLVSWEGKLKIAKVQSFRKSGEDGRSGDNAIKF